MKNIVFLFTFVACSSLLHAQTEFAPIGARWYYSEPYESYPPPENKDYILLMVVGDTIIDDIYSKVIEVKHNGTTKLCEEYIAQIGDSVFYYNTSNEQFHLLYNFSANIGDTIWVHNKSFLPNCATLYYNPNNDSIANFAYIITNIDSIFISNKWIKRQTVDKLSPYSMWTFTIETGDYYYVLENIGSLVYFWGRANLMYPGITLPLLRCYIAEDMDYHNELWMYECDYITNVSESFDNIITISPNPFVDFIQFNTGVLSATAEILLYDINGKLIKKAFANEGYIDTTLAPSGMYFLKVSEHKYCKTFKLIKL